MRMPYLYLARTATLAAAPVNLYRRSVGQLKRTIAALSIVAAVYVGATATAQASPATHAAQAKALKGCTNC